MSLATMLVPTYLNMLAALSAWLEKGKQQGLDMDAMMAERLADDMFPLATQVRFSCVQALEGVHRLAGKDFPPLVSELLAEGRAAENVAGSLEAAQSRIAQTIEMVREVAADIGEGDPARPLEHAIPTGMVFDFTAEQYARDWALGQFYFHVMIAYAILRSRGAELGKADYVAHLFPFIRPGTMPEAAG